MNLLTLENIKSFLMQLAEHSESVYWLGDPDFSYLAYVSPAYEKIWGRPRQPLYDNPRIWIDHLHPEDQKRHPILEMKDRVASEGLQARFTENYRIIRPDGEVRWIVDRGFPVCDEVGNIIAVTGVGTDVTREKSMEEAIVCEARRQADIANQAQTRFLANMSHDIKTPLSSMIGLTELLVFNLQGKNELDFAQNLLNASRELNAFLEHCIDMARAENSELVLTKEHFNLRVLLNELVLLYKPATMHKQLSFSVHYPDHIAEFFLGSRTGIYRVLLNLISNAIKFTPQGSVIVEVDYSEKSSSAKQIMVKLSVKDTGIGVPKDKQQMIFERYTRVSPSYESVYSGSGLGLYVASQFVKAMQGEIYLFSEEGKGSQFLVVLPLEVPLLGPEEYDKMKNLSAAPVETLSVSYSTPMVPLTINQYVIPKINTVSSRNMNILLVEDNNFCQKIAETILNDLGCQVDIADSGNDALNLFEIDKYDMVFMDIGLPDMSGYAVIEEMRKVESNSSSHVPIIVLTAHATKVMDKNRLDIGAEAIFSKPLSRETASDILNRFVVKTAYQILA